MSARALRAALAGLTLVLGAPLVTACGGDAFTAYCDEVSAQQKDVTEALAQGSQTGLLSALPAFEKLQAKAPADIADDWAVVVNRITLLQQALDDAGVQAADYDPKKPPAGVTQAQQDAIAAAADGLLNPAVSTAFDHVQQQARDVCKTPLSV